MGRVRGGRGWREERGRDENTHTHATSPLCPSPPRAPPTPPTQASRPWSSTARPRTARTCSTATGRAWSARTLWRAERILKIEAGRGERREERREEGGARPVCSPLGRLGGRGESEAGPLSLLSLLSAPCAHRPHAASLSCCLAWGDLSVCFCFTPAARGRASERARGWMGGEGARPPSLCARLPLDPPALPLSAAPSSPFLWAAYGVDRVCAFFWVCVSAKNLCFLERENHSCLAPPGETFRRRPCGAPVPPVPPHPALTHEREPPCVTGTGRAGRTPCPASPQARRRRRWATCVRARARRGTLSAPSPLSRRTHTQPPRPPPRPPRPPTHHPTMVAKKSAKEEEKVIAKKGFKVG